MLALALWRGPLGSDEAARAPGPLDRVEVALAGAERVLSRSQEALEAAMVTQSLNQQLERAGIGARFDPARGSTLVCRARALAGSLAHTVPSDASVRVDVGELHLVSIAHYMMSQLAAIAPETMTEECRARRLSFLSYFFAAVLYRSRARPRYDELTRDMGVIDRVDTRIRAMIAAHVVAHPPVGPAAAPLQPPP